MSAIAAPERRVYTVSELTRDVRGLLEDRFSDVWIEGEISNLRSPASGHRYFTLKDADAQLRCVVFRYQEGGLRCEPEDGLKVLARGQLTVYEPRGDYQLIVGYMEPLGLGLLQRAFEKLKERLAAEGLFDAERKRPLPFLPQTIGVVTSPTGAALRDIVAVIQRRFANVHLLVAPVRVQGEGAAQEIASALAAFDRRDDLDVVIVARGGGSLEDLWAFNEEAVARAIAASRAPVVSAVGHETDHTIADFVADLRAPTPSAAAELVVQAKADLVGRLRLLHRRLVAATRTEQTVLAHRLASLCRRRPLASPYVVFAPVVQRFDEARFRLGRGIRDRLTDSDTASRGLARELALLAPRPSVEHLRRRAAEARRHLSARIGSCVGRLRHRLGVAAGRLDALSPLNVLERGYAIARRLPERRLVTDAAQLSEGDALLVTLRHGEVEAEVREAQRGER